MSDSAVKHLGNKRILLGVTGGIAAYKAAELVRRLQDQGADIRVVMTQAATEFITPLTMQALSGHPVHPCRWLQRLLFKPPGPVLNLVGESDLHRSRLFATVKKFRKKIVGYNTVDGRSTAPPSDEMLAVLRDTFRSDSALLADLLGRDLSHWYNEAPPERELVA